MAHWREDGMHSRALPAALHLTAPGARPLRTGNLSADCERWCRDHLAPRRTGSRSAVGLRTTTAAMTVSATDTNIRAS